MEPKLFKIPIRIYEKDMETELGKAKKKEILDIFANCNNFHSEEEFEEVKCILHELCMKGDVDLIKIYLNETVEDEFKDFSFKIDKTNQTASLFEVKKNARQIIIPRSIKHESTEYLITSISGIWNDTISKIKFVEDSAIKTFYRNAFGVSQVEEIYFPANLKELKEGWCAHTSLLTKIAISPSNSQFKFVKNKYLIGKSDENKDEFDILFFGCREIKEISVPSNIKIISSDAFRDCFYLTKVEFEINSNLLIIGSDAFEKSNVDEIFIPSTVLKICQCAFYHCDNLTKINIFPNSNLQIIETAAFAYSNIKEIFIPSKVLKICKRAFCECKNLTKVEIPTNSNLQIIESNAFEESNIKEIFIPSTVIKICEFAFYKCTNLAKVEIPSNSNLQIIERFAFEESKVKKIFIPSTVTKICEDAFCDCKNLTKVDIPHNSNLQIIEFCAFCESKIKDFFIPSKVSQIGKEIFFDCKLQIIEISEDSKLDSFPFSAFLFCSEFIIMIPSSLKKLIN